MPLRSILRPLAIISLAVSLAACGTLNRPDGPLRLNDGRSPVTVTQAQASVDARITNFLAEFGSLMADGTPTNILALSGGGANGAYGGGLLVGWTEAGTRPEFDIVTGVSTGALAAPFAFLGPSWDDKLTEAYTSGQSDNLIGFRTFSAMLNPSLFSSRRLHRLVDSYVTPELLSAIAVEHAKGRRLLVATTNLDTEESVIWDMGKIASSNDPGARDLFKRVLVASASIPGVFPPVLLPALTPEGEVILEMHVDGGVNVPYLGVPEGLMLWTTKRPLEELGGGSVYVVVNGQTGRNTGTTPGSISGILSRTYDSMSKASLRTHLAVTAGFARRNGLELSVTAIPDNVHASALAFDQTTMSALFELARERGRDGSAWLRLDDHDPSSDFVPPNEVVVDVVPAAIQPADNTPDQQDVAPDAANDNAPPAQSNHG